MSEKSAVLKEGLKEGFVPQKEFVHPACFGDVSTRVLVLLMKRVGRHYNAVDNLIQGEKLNAETLVLVFGSFAVVLFRFFASEVNVAAEHLHLSSVLHLQITQGVIPNPRAPIMLIFATRSSGMFVSSCTSLCILLNSSWTTTLDGVRSASS